MKVKDVKDWFNRKVIRTDAAGGELSGMATRSYNKKMPKLKLRLDLRVKPAARI